MDICVNTFRQIALWSNDTSKKIASTRSKIPVLPIENVWRIVEQVCYTNCCIKLSPLLFLGEIKVLNTSQTLSRYTHKATAESSVAHQGGLCRILYKNDVCLPADVLTHMFRHHVKQVSPINKNNCAQLGQRYVILSASFAVKYSQSLARSFSMLTKSDWHWRRNDEYPPSHDSHKIMAYHSCNRAFKIWLHRYATRRMHMQDNAHPSGAFSSFRPQLFNARTEEFLVFDLLLPINWYPSSEEVYAQFSANND